MPKPFLMLALRISDQGPWKLEGHQFCFSCETSASLESYNNQQSTWIHSTRKLLVFQVYSLNLRPIGTNKQKNSKLQWSFYFSQSIVLTLMLVYLDVQSLCNSMIFFFHCCLLRFILLNNMDYIVAHSLFVIEDGREWCIQF